MKNLHTESLMMPKPNEFQSGWRLISAYELEEAHYLDGEIMAWACVASAGFTSEQMRGLAETSTPLGPNCPCTRTGLLHTEHPRCSTCEAALMGAIPEYNDTVTMHRNRTLRRTADQTFRVHITDLDMEEHA